MSQSVKDVLIAARMKIANPSAWGQGARGGLSGHRTIETCCAAEAIEELTSGKSFHLRVEAFDALKNAIGLRFDCKIIDWNDTHTHAEVLAAFDKAIAECGA